MHAANTCAQDKLNEDEAAGDSEKPVRKPSSGATPAEFEFKLSDLSSEERTIYESLPASEQEEWREEARQVHDYMTQPHIVSDLTGEVSKLSNEFANRFPRRVPEKSKVKPGLLAMGEDADQIVTPDPEFEGDDITSLAHGELEQHREMRQYARLAVWEMPLLHKLSKPFTPPTLAQPLRFRYTTYMGETHPAAKKIVLEFSTKDIAIVTGLTEPQRIKLIKLVGVRYNPTTDVVKMSSESFETQAQNKRYLGDLVNTLVTEAKDDTDTFADIPLDFRHHKEKKRWEFPDQWKLNEPRRQQMFLDRKARMELEGEREELGKIVQGQAIIATAMNMLPSRDESRVLVEAQQGQGQQARKGRTAPRLR